MIKIICGNEVRYVSDIFFTNSHTPGCALVDNGRDDVYDTCISDAQLEKHGLKITEDDRLMKSKSRFPVDLEKKLKKANEEKHLELYLPDIVEILRHIGLTVPDFPFVTIEQDCEVINVGKDSSGIPLEITWGV